MFRNGVICNTLKFCTGFAHTAVFQLDSPKELETVINMKMSTTFLTRQRLCHSGYIAMKLPKSSILMLLNMGGNPLEL